MRVRSVLPFLGLLSVQALTPATTLAQQAQTQPTSTPQATQVAPSARAGEAEVGVGIAAYEAADFDAALQAFERAETLGLDRELLVRVLSHRVLIAQAAGDTSALEAQALRLVTLEPEALRQEASPDLTRALEHARSRADGIVRIRIESEVEGDHVLVRARVEGDAAGIVREVRLFAGRDRGELVPANNAVVRLEGSTLEGIVLVAECIGPGNAMLAHEGTVAAPTTLAAMTARSLLAQPIPATNDDTALHVGLALGGAAVVIAAVVITVLVVDANAPRSQLSGPVVEW